jgi:hypothetical protein
MCCAIFNVLIVSLLYSVTGIFVKRRTDTIFTFCNVLDCSRYRFVIVSYNSDVYNVLHYSLIYVFVLFVSTTCANFTIGLWAINSAYK